MENTRLFSLCRRVERLVDFAGMDTTKRFLRSVKADPTLAKRVNFLPNGKLSRDSLQSGFNPNDTWITRKLAPLQGYSPRQGVTVGKSMSPKKGDPASNLLSIFNKADGGIATRRNAAIHEIGHAADVAGTKRLGTVTGTLGQIFSSPKKNAMTAVKLERTANRNVTDRMRKVGATDSEIKSYRREIRPAFNSYRSSAIRTYAGRGQLSALPMGETKKILRNNPSLRNNWRDGGLGFSRF